MTQEDAAEGGPWDLRPATSSDNQNGGEGVERGSEGSEREVEDALSDVGENQDV